MRRVLILFLLLTIASPLWAEKQMTVAQLEQTLASETDRHQSDVEIAQKISGIELSERLTDGTLGRLNKHFAKDSQAALALDLLADRSAFLEPPASELPDKAAPNVVTQKTILRAAQRFALETLPACPT